MLMDVVFNLLKILNIIQFLLPNNNYIQVFQHKNINNVIYY